MKAILLSLVVLLVNACEMTSRSKPKFKPPVDVLTVNVPGDVTLEYFTHLARVAKGRSLADLPKPPQEIDWEPYLLPLARSKFWGRHPGGQIFVSEVVACSEGHLSARLAVNAKTSTEEVAKAIEGMNTPGASASRVLDVAVYFYPFVTEW